MKKLQLWLTSIVLILSFFVLSVALADSFNQQHTIIPKGKRDVGVWMQEIGNKGDYPGGFGVFSNIATRGIEIFRGDLYIGTQNLDIEKISFLNLKLWITIGLLTYSLFESIGENNILINLINIVVPLQGSFGEGCEVWRYNYSQDKWQPLVSDKKESVISAGFGDNNNFAASVIQSFKGELYIGTGASSRYGCEIWRWDGSSFTKVVEGGFDDPFNSGVWCAAEYNSELYIGTMNWNTGCQLWKTRDGDNWIKVLLPDGDGFGTRWNVYAWSMNIYNGSLFIGTCNINRSQGSQLWKYNGSQWQKMNLPGGDGFGEADNYGIRNIVTHNNEMYVASSTSYVQKNVACEIWKFDGLQWHPLIGEEGELGDGFGNLYNKYAWSMITTSDGNLLVGTFNLMPVSSGLPFKTQGCEIWQYNGIDWICLVGENGDDGIKGGFGDNLNMGARSMIEYPQQSGIIWVGTWNMDIQNFKTFNGCEIWKRIP